MHSMRDVKRTGIGHLRERFVVHSKEDVLERHCRHTANNAVWLRHACRLHARACIRGRCLLLIEHVYTCNHLHIHNYRITVKS